MKRLILLSALVLTAMALCAPAPAVAVGPNAVSHLAGCTDNTLPANDDGSTDTVPLPFGLDFFGSPYSSIYVNNNGNVTFTEPLDTFTPEPILASGLPIIAPFWGDVDTRGAGSDVVTYGNTTFQGQPAFCVMWDGIGVGYYSGNTDKLNNFQLLLVDRSDVGSGDFDIVFNYDQIQWETGDASGGSGGLGGDSARWGFSDGSTTSFEGPGSAVNGALLDSSATGLIHDSRNSLQLGRYVFPVRNGQPPGSGQISGTVRDSASNTVAGALVQACRVSDNICAAGRTNALGGYSLTGLADGDYTVRAFPPANSNAIPGQISRTIVDADSVTDADITLGGPAPPPAGTGISPSRPGGGGVPSVFWSETLTLSTTGCSGGTATFTVTGAGGNQIASGPLSGSGGNYSGSVGPFLPNSGPATVRITIDCPTGPDEVREFPIYIDPSGDVRTVQGAPIAGATVTLLRSDSGLPGTFVQVPGGDAIMSTSNRRNPDTTNASGHFGWDVIAGFYVVRAQRAGCTSPDGTALFVESAVMTIPPPVTNLDLRLSCNQPPVCSAASATPSTLWPANHKLNLIRVGGVTDPDGNPVSIVVTTVTQDEPLNGTGDGDTSPDARRGPSSREVYLRAERKGNGNGRVYRVSFTASDGQGGSCGGSVLIGVPHNNKGTAVNSGQTVNSFGT